MNSEQIIKAQLQTYRTLSLELGKDNPHVIGAFCKLRDLVVVEIYFMKAVRCVVKDEEMSGFIIYVNKDIRNIVDSYRQSRGEFMGYLKEAMERRAFSYLRDRNRSINFNKSYIERQNTYSLLVSEETPEDMLCMHETEIEWDRRQKAMFDTLRCICSQNPSRVRKLFVFLCTLMPFLSEDVIDGFCVALNCDRSQTETISELLYDIKRKEDRSRSSKAYLSKMVNYHWSKVMESDSKMRLSLRKEKPMIAVRYHRQKHVEALKGFRSAKMNVSYKAVAQLMNLDTTTVGLYVMHAKRLLRRVLESPTDRTIRALTRKQEIGLPRFEPFREFGMEVADMPA